MFNIDLKETAETIKTTAIKANKDVIKASDKIVEETLAAGEDWQKVLAKALKTGTTVFGQQQEVTLTILEGLKTQVLKGNKRFVKLFGLEAYTPEVIAKEAKKTIKKAKKTFDAVENQATEVLEEVTKEAKKVFIATTKSTANLKAAKTAKKAAKSTKKVIATTAPKTKKAVLTTVKEVEKATTSTTKATKAPAVKVTAPKATTKKVATKIDLTAINGIGPKMKSILNANGILTFTDLAKANQKELESMLVAINKRYVMYDVAAWISEANKMAK